MRKLFGVTTAMITPLDGDDRVDLNAVKSLTEMLIEKGVDCLYPCGTTGEMLRLSVDERKAVAETVVETAAGRVVVYIHVGAMRMDDTLELAKHAEAIGANGIGVVTPQFFSISDEDMETYFATIAKSVSDDFPIYLYNIPQCASNDLKPSVITSIVESCPNVVGIKYSWADMNRTLEYLNINNSNFSVLHGSDKLIVSLLAMGCDGVVSGCACVFPEPFVNAYQAYMAKDIDLAEKWGRVCVKIVDALKAGSNISYFKEALTARGLFGGQMRKPQQDISEAERKRFISELKNICTENGLKFDLNE